MEFKHGGEDTKNWAGHYGAKMSMSAVFVGQKRKKRAKRVSLIFESRHRKTVYMTFLSSLTLVIAVRMATAKAVFLLNCL